MLAIVIIQELVIVLAASALAVYVLRNVRLPSIVGLLLAGLLIGPHGLALIRDRAVVEVLAEVGVIFLMFTIGLRFSFRELMRLRGLVFGAGALQLAATSLLATGVASWAGAPLRQAVFLGLLVGMSSTAIVLRLLEERGEIVAPHGRLMVAILLFQDVAVIPLMLCLPLLGADLHTSALEALGTVALSVGLLLVIISAARFVLPWVLRRVVRTRSRELFTLSTVLAALGTAWSCSLVGASLPLGAFLAGVVLSESRYAQQVLSDILPLRDVFASLFFVSVGMLVDPGTWVSAPGLMLGLLLAVVIGKALVVALIAQLFGFGGRVAILAGLGLAQIGEFSLIIAAAGREYGLLPDHHEQPFFTVAVVSMALAPLTALMAQGLATRSERLVWLSRYLRRMRPDREAEPDGETRALENHVVIVGFGINGRNVARVLHLLEVPYLVLELNPHTVRLVRAEGDLIQYGDATREDVLGNAGIATARSLVVTIADPAAARRIVAVARCLNANVQILVRTRFVREVDQLLRLGADKVVPEEFETSLELAGLVMETYGAGPGTVLREKIAMRNEHYAALLRSPTSKRDVRTLDQLLASAKLEHVTVDPDSCAEGATLLDLDLRRRTGATVLLVDREGIAMPNPGDDLSLAAGDRLAIFGTARQVEAARAILKAETSQSA